MQIVSFPIMLKSQEGQQFGDFFEDGTKKKILSEI